MKTIYSLKEFRDMVKEIAIKVEKKYIAITVKLVTYDIETNRGNIEYSIYIDGYGIESGYSMEDALHKMKEKCFKTEPMSDVEIDVTAEEIQQKVPESVTEN